MAEAVSPRGQDAPSGSTVSPHVLREYAFLADGERGALVSPIGEVAWLCFPAWDSKPLFGALLGGPGSYLIRPTSKYVWGGQYEEGTLIWRNRWLSGASIIECIETLAFPGDRARAVLVRRLVALAGDAELSVSLDVPTAYSRGRFGFTNTARTMREMQSDGLHLRWQTPESVRDAPGNAFELQLRSGDVADLVLEISLREPDDAPPTADAVLDSTGEAWRKATRSALAESSIAPRDAQQAIAVLRGMTTSAGSMVAAATTSLPERAEKGRNYDYRYAWIRDQCYAGTAAAAAGTDELVDAAVRFVHERLIEDGPRLRPAYRANAAPVPAEHALDLPGYPGAPDVVVGNRVGDQFQLDAFGEALQLFAAAEHRGRMHADAWRAAEIAVQAIGARWRLPDNGIWELEPQHFTHSRLACVAGLRRLAAARPGRLANDWLALADRIAADAATTSVHASGRWRRTPTDDRVDASLLIAGIRGAMPPDDPRVLLTNEAIRSELSLECFTYRFRSRSGELGSTEGAFLLCGFWMALALYLAGDELAAMQWFERNRASYGSPGLYSEEYDVHQRQLRGNFPQAFVHAVLLETATTLSR
ncbi:MAG TPA: glycoside hydrolase family 15 protein [Acidimicrobiia bacterium]